MGPRCSDAGFESQPGWAFFLPALGKEEMRERLLSKRAIAIRRVRQVDNAHALGARTPWNLCLFHLSNFPDINANKGDTFS